jgi:hypothetical protein
VYLGYLTVVGSALGWVLHRDPDTYRYIRSPSAAIRSRGRRGDARPRGIRREPRDSAAGWLMAINARASLTRVNSTLQRRQLPGDAAECVSTISTWKFSDVRRRIRAAIDGARLRAAERRASADEASRAYDQFLEATAVPPFTRW